MNEGWEEEHGGQLMMYDATGAAGPCWRSVPPRAGTLVLFRSDRVLHKVAPSFRTRYALTIFFGARYGKRAAEDPQAAKMRSLGYA